MIKLPLRDFADVIAAMKGPVENLGASEKRRAARMSVSAKVNVYLLDGDRIGRTFSVLSRDISLTGMGVLQSVAVAAESFVILALPREHQPLFVISKVMHARPLADGLLAVGMDFERIADAQTASQLLKDDAAVHARIRQSVLQ